MVRSAALSGADAAGGTERRLTLPRADDQTLSRYLLSVARSISEQVNRGLTGEAATRLRECATIVARVAQQIESARGEVDWTAASEAGDLIESEAIFARAEAARAGATAAATSAAIRTLDREALQRYLRRHPLGGAELVISDAQLLAGGRCKLTARITQEGSSQLPATFILRQDWAGGATATTVAGEFALLQRVARGGIRAPRPLLLEPVETEIGKPFILLERMPGTLTGSLFTPPRSPALGRQLAEQLGRLHSLPVEDFRGVVPEPSRSAAVLAEQLAGFRQAQASIGLRSRLIDAAIEWLARHIADAGTAVSLVHNDVGFHNCLIEGERLSAVLDWELAELGHPAADLGYVKPFVPLMLEWDDFLGAYTAAGGWRPDPATLRFHTIWSAVRLYGLIMRARASLAAGLTSDVEITFACADNVMLLMVALATELRAAGVLTPTS